MLYLPFFANGMESFIDQKTEIQIEPFKGGRVLPQMLGYSAVVMSGEREERITIGLHLTKLPMNGFDLQSINTEIQALIESKKKWLATKENSGEFNFIGKNITTNSKDIHFVKMSYLLDGSKTFEKTYFINCADKMMKIKAMVPLKNRDQDKVEKDIDVMVRSIRCTLK